MGHTESDEVKEVREKRATKKDIHARRKTEALKTGKRLSPHYDQQNMLTCESFAWGRIMRKAVQYMFEFLPFGTISEETLSLLHMNRAQISHARFQELHLQLLFDYYYIHLVTYLKRHNPNKKTSVLLTRAHNNYPPPSVVFNRDDPENTLFEQMLTEISRIKLVVFRYDRPFPAEVKSVIKSNIDEGIPVCMNLLYSSLLQGHAVEVVDMDEDHFIVRNAYSDLELVKIPISNLDDDGFEDWNGHTKVKIRDIQLLAYEMSGKTAFLNNFRHDVQEQKRSNPDRQLFEEISNALRALVEQFKKMPKSPITVEEPECSETCTLIYRTMEVLFNVSRRAIEQTPCPELDEWVALIQTSDMNEILKEQLNVAVTLVSMNSIEGEIIIDASSIREHLQVNPDDEATISRLFPKSYRMFAVQFNPEAKRIDTKPEPLPMILDMVEQGSRWLEPLLLSVNLIPLKRRGGRTSTHKSRRTAPARRSRCR